MYYNSTDNYSQTSGNWQNDLIIVNNKFINNVQRNTVSVKGKNLCTIINDGLIEPVIKYLNSTFGILSTSGTIHTFISVKSTVPSIFIKFLVSSTILYFGSLRKPYAQALSILKISVFTFSGHVYR